MGLLYDLSTEYKTLSIVGMAKNAGKTTALNYLIEEADDEMIRLGITSTGRDGETSDLVTGTEKPRVYLTRTRSFPFRISCMTWRRPGWRSLDDEVQDGDRGTHALQGRGERLCADRWTCGNRRHQEDVRPDVRLRLRN